MMYHNARLLVMAQLTAVSSAVVQRHTPLNRKARACDVWCEALAPQTAKSQGETPPFVPSHHGMTKAFSGVTPDNSGPCHLELELAAAAV